MQSPLSLAAARCLSPAALLSASVSHAAKPFAAPTLAEGATTSPASGLASVMVSLLFVLAAVFAAAWVMRRLRAGTAATRGAMEVLADLPLGTKERAVLIRVGRQQLVLGVAPGRVNTLHVFPEGSAPVTIAKVEGTALGHPNAPATPDFKAILRRSLGL